MASCCDIIAPTTAPISSLKYGKCHLSGDSITPSSEMKSPAWIFPIELLPSGCADFLVLVGASGQSGGEPLAPGLLGSGRVDVGEDVVAGQDRAASADEAQQRVVGTHTQEA